MSTPTDHIPTATPATPNPVADALRRYWLVAAAFVLGVMLACPCGIVGGRWMAGPREVGVGAGGGPVGDGGGKGKAIPGKIAAPPRDSMTFQELQDRLKAGGLDVSRVATRRRGGGSMWFGQGIKNEHPEVIEALDEAGTLWENNFLVTKMADAQTAQAGVEGIKDVAQRPAIAWGPFVIQGREDNLDRLKKALGK